MAVIYDKRYTEYDRDDLTAVELQADGVLTGTSLILDGNVSSGPHEHVGLLLEDGDTGDARTIVSRDSAVCPGRIAASQTVSIESLLTVNASGLLIVATRGQMAVAQAIEAVTTSGGETAVIPVKLGRWLAV